VKPTTARPDQPALVRFRELGGLNEAIDLEPGQAHRVKDMSAPPGGGWRNCRGASRVITTTAPVHRLHWFTRHNGRVRFLLVEYGTASAGITLGYVHWPSSSVVTIESGLTFADVHRAPPSYVNAREWVYRFDGLNEPFRWNGRQKQPVGFDRLPASPHVFSGLNTGTTLTRAVDHGGSYDNGLGRWYATAGLNAEFADYVAHRGVGPTPTSLAVLGKWKYGYAISYVNDLGQESPLSAVAYVSGSGVQLNDPNGVYARIAVRVEVDRPLQTSVRKIRVYRTRNIVDLAGAPDAPLYYLGDMYPNQRAFYDDKPDNELGPEADLDGTGLLPSRVKYAAWFKGRLYLAGAPDGLVRYSHPTFHEQFPANNWLNVGNAATGEDRGFFVSKDALFLFRERGIYVIRDEPGQLPTVQTITETEGCSSPDAVIEVPGVGILLLGPDGPKILTGSLRDDEPTSLQYIGHHISESWKRVNRAALMRATACLSRREREVWIQVPADGDWRPSLGFVLHYASASWSLREDWQISHMVESPDAHGDVLAGCWNTGANYRGIWHLTRASNAKVGTVSLDPQYALIGAASPDEAAGRVQDLYVVPRLHLAGSGRSVTVSRVVERRQETGTTQRTLTTGAQERPETALAEWGVATWSASEVWPWPEIYPFRIDLRGDLSWEVGYRISGNKFWMQDISVATVRPTTGDAHWPLVGGR